MDLDRLAALLAMVLSFLLPPPSPLHTETLNTGPFRCAPGKSELIEVNSQSRIKYLRKVYIWTGLDMGARADLVIHLVKTKIGSEDGADAETLAVGCVDRYAEPTSLQGQTLWFDFSPHVVPLSEKQQVRMYVQCNNFSKDTRAHVQAVLYFTDKPY